MGEADDWQKEVENFYLNSDVTFFNPRRDDWDSTQKQEYENPVFYQQVSWELDALEKADKIIMYFAAGTKSPISLMEFGLYAPSGKMVVACPRDFWRAGNVEVVCQKYNIPFYRSIPELLMGYQIVF